MQVKATAPAPLADPAEYEKLREFVTRPGVAGAVAVALAASDLGKRAFLAWDGALAFAVQGMARIGVDTAVRTAEQIRSLTRADIALMDRGATMQDPQRRALARQEAALWGVKFRQQSWCWDVAYRLGDLRSAQPSPAARAGHAEYAPAARSRVASRSIGARYELVRAA